MAWRRLVMVLLGLVWLGGCREQMPVRRDIARLGRVRVYRLAERPHGFVYVISDRGGWTEPLDRAARSLAALGAVAIGVDLDEYLRRLRASDDGCHYVISEMEVASRDLQREYEFDGYHSPIIAGVGEGGAFAYAALAQAPAATVEGAVSIDPTPELHTRVPFCPGAPSSLADGGFRYGAQPDLPGWWVLSSHDPSPAELGRLATPGPTEGGAAERLVAALTPRLATAAAPASEESVAKLPLVELPPRKPGTLLAIIYSGDGGWRDLDKQIAGVLVKEGVAVVGVDSLRYFWRTKSPDEIAADLSTIVRHYRAHWGERKIVLIGYSFGADILPFAFNRLPESDRAAVMQLSLLGLSEDAPFQVDPKAWFGFRPTDTLPLEPEVERLDLKQVQCFYGTDEKDTLCPSELMHGAEVIATKGGHHFDGDYVALAGRILDGARRRAGAAPSQPLTSSSHP